VPPPFPPLLVPPALLAPEFEFPPLAEAPPVAGIPPEPEFPPRLGVPPLLLLPLLPPEEALPPEPVVPPVCEVARSGVLAQACTPSRSASEHAANVARCDARGADNEMVSVPRTAGMTVAYVISPKREKLYLSIRGFMRVFLSPNPHSSPRRPTFAHVGKAR